MEMEKGYDIGKIAGNFQFRGVFRKAEPNISGHINDTYIVYYDKGSGVSQRYILQRINHNVFKEPEKVMENIIGITRHMREKIIKAGGDPLRETLNLIPTNEGGYLHRSEDGNYWRGYLFIDGARTYQTVENKEHFYKAGKAFGNFQRLLSDYPVENLHETIPNFHNTKMRFDAFVDAVEKDVMNRAKDVKEEIEFALKRADDTPILVDLLEKGELPLRVTHNDTKFNNVMIDDKTGEGICVIDLDTVMPGLSLYDFEIPYVLEQTAPRMKGIIQGMMDLNLCEKYTKGFLEGPGQPYQNWLEYLAFLLS